MRKILLAFISLFLMGSIFAQDSVTFQVDMSADTTFNPAVQHVYLSGSMVGWAKPGFDTTLMLTPDANNAIYSIMLTDVPAGANEYKYFIVVDTVESWGGGEWDGDPNRVAVITESTTLNDVWGNKPSVVSFFVDMTKDSTLDVAHDQVFIAGDLANSWAEPGSIPYFEMMPTDTNANIYSINLTLYNNTYQYKYFIVKDSVNSWGGGEWATTDNRTVVVDTTMTVNNIWGLLLDVPTHTALPSFNIYPNPVNDNLSIANLKNANRIEVYNLVGQKVKEINEIFGSKVNLQTGDLSNGMYIISVYGENSSAVKSLKFLKK